MGPTEKFNKLHEAWLEWKREPDETRGPWLHAKANHYRKMKASMPLRRRRKNV